VELWFDPFSDTNEWTPSSANRVSMRTGSDYCTSAECVRISGYRRQDASITRVTPNEYNSYRLKFDVVLSNMETNDYCEVFARFGASGDWQKLGSYQGSNDRYRYRESGIVFENEDPAADEMYVKLATNGGSWSGLDFCSYDNAYLYGTGRAAATQSSAAKLIGAGKKASTPFALEHQSVQQQQGKVAETEHEAVYGKFVAIGSTGNTLVWIGLLSVWCIVYVAFVWFHRQKQRRNANHVNVDEYDDSEVADVSAVRQEAV
jgi:hypothetical protein